MNIKAEKKMRIQAYHYRDGMLVKDIAKVVGISQAIVRKYLASVDEQLASGEIKREDIISSCNTLGIDRPKKVRKQEVDEILSDQGVTQQQLSENVKALDDAVAEAGEVDGAGIGFDEISATQYQLSESFQSRGGIVKPIKGHEPDGGKEMATPIKKQRRGGRQRQIVEIDGEPANKKMKERSPELDIITKYMTKSLLTLDDITKILDASAELKNCGYTAEEIVLTLNELKYFSDEIDNVGKKIGMSAEYLKDIKEPLAEFCKPAKNPSPEFTAEQLREVLTEPTISEVNINQMAWRANREPKQSDYVLTIMGHIYDDLVAGNIKLSHYIMENGMHELQFTEVGDDNSN